MPEGPEVRRYADALHNLLAGRRLSTVAARTKAAKAWLAENPHAFANREVLWVRSRGKNLVGLCEGGLYFYSHLMMWGRWELYADEPPPDAWDRRERARVTAESGHPAAVLLSAPVFEVGESNGDPFAEHPYLANLGPDLLPYPGQDQFSADCFAEKLTAPENREREVGAALLDQKIAAGIGNYLRAEILFAAGISPFRRIANLRDKDIAALCRLAPEVTRNAYENNGVTVPPETRARIRADRTRFVYPNGSDEWGTRHWVFRRTNLLCAVCQKASIRQKRQLIWQTDEEDKERIIYFCPVCQAV